MEKPYQVVVFGKTGCDKCKTMQKRVDELLSKPEWADFEKAYFDVETVDGLVAYSKAECLNPQRLPALVVRRATATGSELIAVEPSAAPDLVLGQSRLYHILGLQTDYSEEGGGVVSPRMIAAVLSSAREAVPVAP
ncbi:MAG: hypothetical protein KJ579_02090 [Verrucomicrobia bacterium]|nr:hypothetical protein [Verrucomicrobiota bacterium]